MVSPLVAPGLFVASALVCLAAAALILGVSRKRLALGLAAAAAAAALWLGLVALSPEAPLDGLAGAAETGRSAVWFAVLLALYAAVGGARVRGPVVRFGIAGAALAALALAATVPALGAAIVLPSLGSPALLARLGLAIATALLAENLYRNADETARWHINLPCIALGSLSILDLLLYADAVLERRFSVPILEARAVLTALAMALLVLAAARGRRLRRPLQLSREVAFHGATLIAAGTFLLGIGAAGEVLRQFDAGWGGALQVSLAAAALMALAVASASASARSRLRRLVIDHFFAARYDYRREWLRCVDTLSAAAGDAHVRAIRAVADSADSPGGVLMLRDPIERSGAEAQARYLWSGSWNMPEAAGLALPSAHPLIAAVREGAWVATLGDAAPAEIAAAFGRLWLAVPLWHHREGLVGLVLLSPPRAPFPLDVETYDLLRTLGREVAMFLAERAAAERLVDQRQLEDYAKRFAFVAHDVKTVASQLSLLLANAEDNIADPEFQRDMLLTVRASAERINALIARLRQPEATPGARPAPEPEGPVDVAARLAAIVAERRHPVRLEPTGPGRGVWLAAIGQGAFDAAITHLLDNAIEASAPDAPVRIAIRRQQGTGGAGRIEIDIIDQGPGMTPDFVRDRLFRPLATSKPQGSGIGAWQARELVRSAGGELTVLTRPGAGTTMRLSLPAVAEAAAAPREIERRARA